MSYLYEMNEQNKIRHIKSRLQKIYSSSKGGIEEIQTLIGEATKYNSYYCSYCPYDDLGWCDFHGTQKEMLVKHCTLATLKYLEMEEC